MVSCIVSLLHKTRTSSLCIVVVSRRFFFHSTTRSYYFSLFFVVVVVKFGELLDKVYGESASDTIVYQLYLSLVRNISISLSLSLLF